jgi:hypothetical protein
MKEGPAIKSGLWNTIYLVIHALSHAALNPAPYTLTLYLCYGRTARLRYVCDIPKELMY